MPGPADSPSTGRALTRADVRALDARAAGEFGVPGLVLMENAGRSVAECALRELMLAVPAAPEGAPAGAARARPRAVVLCGSGNNGGDGYVVARHLALAGCRVEVASAADPALLRGDAAAMRVAACRLGLAVHDVREALALERAAARWNGADLLVDALLGSGARGSPRQPVADVLRAANAVSARLRVAVDVPSGLDCDDGATPGEVFRADVTATLVAPKVGFQAPGAQRHTGRVEVVHIGIPFPLPDSTGCEVRAP